MFYCGIFIHFNLNYFHENSFYFFILAILLISCDQKRLEVDPSVTFEKDEIKLSSTNNQILSNLSYVLGINYLNNVQFISPNKVKLKLKAGNASINGFQVNLDGSEIYFEKVKNKSYKIESNLNSLGLTSVTLDLENEQISLTHNNETLLGHELSTVSAKKHLSLIVMTTILSELLSDHTNHNSVDSTISHGEQATQCAYYGYTVGWGFTAAESVDHEQCVRDSACENLDTYSCKLIGTETTCVFGSISCTTISTFKCDDGKPCE